MSRRKPKRPLRRLHRFRTWSPNRQPAQGYSTASASETHRDLAAISEVNRLMYRQPSPREVLATTAEQIGKHLGVTRCLISMGRPGESGQIVAEFFAPEVAPADASIIPAIVNLLSSASPDPLGGIELRTDNAPALRELGLESALGVVLTDKETQEPAGVITRWRCAAQKMEA